MFLLAVCMLMTLVDCVKGWEGEMSRRDSVSRIRIFKICQGRRSEKQRR